MSSSFLFLIEDIEARSRFALSRAEVNSLHGLAVNAKISWNFYLQVNNALKADFIYRKSGKQRDWTVAHLRAQLGRTSYQHYSRGGEDIDEWISGRLFPKGWHIERIRSTEDPLHITHEVELAFSPEADLEELWKRQRLELEQEGIALLQKFPDNQFIQDLCLLPGPENFSAIVIVSAGHQRKELVFPIALRYKPLLSKTAEKYDLDTAESGEETFSRQPLQQASTEEMLEAIAGLWSAVRNYDESKDIPVPAYIRNQLAWHMGEEIKRRSTEVEDTTTGKTKRVLRARMDRTGGSLDDLLPDEEGSETRTLGETIADPRAVSPDYPILIQQILNLLIDETDKQILRLTLEGVLQEEIGEILKISQPAISKRLKRIGKKHKY